MRALLLLALLPSLVNALTLQWDNSPNWPVGTTVEACVNGDCIAGITGNQRAFSASPGAVIDARARAIAPDGEASEWATLAQTVPAIPVVLWANRSSVAMAAPTFVAEYPTAFNTATSPKIAMNAVAINSGDVLVGVAASADSPKTLSITENGAGSATLQRSSTATNYSPVYGWAYVAPTGETITVSFSATGGVSEYLGGNVVRFSGSDGVGASAVTTGASGNPSVSLTTTQDNSAIVVIVTDWNATSGTQTFTTTAGTPTALTDYPGDGAQYGVAIAYYADVGAIGSKTVGMSAPTGQKWSIIAIEVKGTAGAAATSLPPYFNYANLLVR